MLQFTCAIRKVFCRRLYRTFGAERLIVASERRDAHKTVLPTYIHTGSISCKHENFLYECTSEL